ncbi:ACT domain-containing protein [uncultured Tateyamaria sp.]|uniref:ACT domain-containing protein n=1 Tax=uncultured Tateyamaria sp. TaxID=455651 RepID=UPI0026073FEF|nr:ACT domain-containing protein [uncultured Tateyamaria sp.]
MTVSDTTEMIAGMTPVLLSGRWVYCTQTDTDKATAHAAQALAIIREAEGVTLILPQDVARTHGYDATLPMRQITLNVFSDLEGVGLTAAVAQALTDENISCNVVAAYHHDHVFVPEQDAERAMAALVAAQQAAQLD